MAFVVFVIFQMLRSIGMGCETRSGYSRRLMTTISLQDPKCRYMVFHAALSVRESARPLNESRKAHKGFQNFLLGFDSDSGTSRTRADRSSFCQTQCFAGRSPFSPG